MGPGAVPVADVAVEELPGEELLRRVEFPPAVDDDIAPALPGEHGGEAEGAGDEERREQTLETRVVASLDVGA